MWYTYLRMTARHRCHQANLAAQSTGTFCSPCFGTESQMSPSVQSHTATHSRTAYHTHTYIYTALHTFQVYIHTCQVYIYIYIYIYIYTPVRYTYTPVKEVTLIVRIFVVCYLRQYLIGVTLYVFMPNEFLIPRGRVNYKQVGRGSMGARVLDCQSSGPGFESTCCRFKTWAILSIPLCPCLRCDIRSHLSLLPGAYARGSKISDTGSKCHGRTNCNTHYIDRV